MTEEKYNGWTNWETWNVSLWLDNDESLYNAVRGLTTEALEETTKELMPTGTPDMDSAKEYNAVNWDEIRCSNEDE